MPRYSAVPTDEPTSVNNHPLGTSLKEYSRKIVKWVYIFDLIRAAIMVGLTGLNIDATIISKLRVGNGGSESIVGGLMVALVKQHGLSHMQKVELGVTIFYVSRAPVVPCPESSFAHDGFASGRQPGTRRRYRRHA